jgi:hypothetical protein
MESMPQTNLSLFSEGSLEPRESKPARSKEYKSMESMLQTNLSLFSEGSLEPRESKPARSKDYPDADAELFPKRHLANSRTAPATWRPLVTERSLLSDMRDTDLFAKVQSYLEVDIPAKIIQMDIFELRVEAIVIQDLEPLDIEVHVVSVGDGSQAIWTHRSRCDTVRFSRFCSYAKQALLRGYSGRESPDHISDFLPLELCRDDLSQEEWSRTLEAVLAQATSTRDFEREQAAVALAAHASCRPTFCTLLAKVLVSRRDIVLSLLLGEVATFGTQFAAAAALAYTCAHAHMGQAVMRGLTSLLGDLQGASGELPAAVQRELTRASLSLQSSF